ncbi:SDR family oxidoreductase [Nocardia callitridis]|uniref:SDR family oxidoreductase n=1 Tax=Nocardia callitridis TaxID=648753 RepID=A0ABP9K3R9_9NOCA
MTVAVTGASGQLGRLVVLALVEQGIAPVALVRDPAKGGDLAERGVEIRQADYNDPEGFERALDGVRKLLLISGSENGSRVPQHTNVIRAAERAGVELLAYTSIPDATHNPMILAREHRATEEVLAESSLGTVLLRNGWYWENYLPRLTQAAESGVLYGAAGDGRVAAATRRDYALAAATVLSTEGHEGRVYELGGDEPLTLAELAQVFSAASGKPIRYENLSEPDYAAALRQAGLPEFVAEFSSNADAGSAAGWLDVRAGDLHKLIGRRTTSAADAIRAALG